MLYIYWVLSLFGMIDSINAGHQKIKASMALWESDPFFLHESVVEDNNIREFDHLCQ
uniref:Uncharacterized protein n=1 Tax=Magnetococcus massalia (strain MO-1) TaxID=451514 RepID=A0A1S7LFN6_MAGMO|nr:protein of unknown function [Candidatus Magnetococcus massalia]